MNEVPPQWHREVQSLRWDVQKVTETVCHTVSCCIVEVSILFPIYVEIVTVLFAADVSRIWFFRAAHKSGGIFI